MHGSIPGSFVLHYLLEFAQIHIHQVSDADYLILCCLLLLLPSVSPRIRVFFQWAGSSHQVPKYWSFSLSISPSNDYSGLISFRIDWFNLLVLQGRRRLREQPEPGGCNSSELTRPCLSSLFPPAHQSLPSHWRLASPPTTKVSEFHSVGLPSSGKCWSTTENSPYPIPREELQLCQASAGACIRTKHQGR